MNNTTKISEEQIIECFGSIEKYENIAMQVTDVLRKEISLKQLEPYFKDINITEKFVYPFLQNWIKSNSHKINSVLDLRKNVFSKDEINDFIEAHTIISQEELEIKFDELFGDGLTDEQLQRKKQLQAQRMHITQEEALEGLRQENADEIEELRDGYSDSKLNNQLQYYYREGFIRVSHNPKEFNVNLKHLLITQENTEMPTPTDEKGFYDFPINKVQIATMFSPLGGGFMQIYIPDKEYPVGMTRSEFISNESTLKLKFEEELKALYKRYQEQGIDVNAILKRILELDKEKIR